MQPQTIHLLNQLNQQFYQTTASTFDATRSHPWEGWHPLLPYIRNLAPRPVMRVLDVGCGNGRFGAFLADNLDLPFSYTGLDSNTYLLERAAQLLTEKKVTYQLEKVDLLTDEALNETYDVIALFGVLHHIPSFAARRALLASLMQHLTPDGLLLLTFWTFYEQERFRQRIIPWTAEQVPPAYHHLDIEPHDYLLDWRQGASALRYCHYVDPSEAEKLLEGYPILTTFDADTSNRYVVLKSPDNLGQ